MDTKQRDDPDNKVPGRFESKVCENCITKGERIIAKAFCESCNNFQCNNCIEGHYKYPGLKEHTFIYLNTEGKEITALTMKDLSTCKKHKMDASFFCKNDTKVICSTCFIAEHRGCKDVVELTEVASEGEVKLREIQNEFDELGKEVNIVIDDIEDLKETMSRQVKNLPKVITEKRTNIDSCLRDVKHKIFEEISAIKSKYTPKLKANEILCKFVLDECKKCNEILTNMSETSTKEKFIAKKLLEKRFEIINDVCKGISEVEEVNIFLELEETFQLLEKTGGKIGTLAVTQMKTDRVSRDFRSVQMQTILSKELEMDEGDTEITLISGIDFFPNGRIVIVDNKNRKIKIFDEKLDDLNTPYKLDYHPQDVVVTSNEEFAVTARVDHKIDIFRASLSGQISLVKSINSKYQLQNIAVGEKDCFLVGHFQEVTPLSLISSSGEEKDLDIEWIPAQYEIVDPSHSIGCLYLQRCKKVVLCHPFENAIHIYDTELNTKVKVKSENIRDRSQVVHGPFNSFFVCNLTENSSIIHMSSTGHILSDYKLGIDNALAVGISKDYRKLLISTNESKTERKLHLVEIKMLS